MLCSRVPPGSHQPSASPGQRAGAVGVAEDHVVGARSRGGSPPSPSPAGRRGAAPSREMSARNGPRPSRLSAATAAGIATRPSASAGERRRPSGFARSRPTRERLPPRVIRARRRALHDAVRERVDRRQRGLVVVGRGRSPSSRTPATRATAEASTHSSARHREVHVEVVAVGGVHVVAQPNAGIGEHDLRAGHPRGDAVEPARPDVGDEARPPAAAARRRRGAPPRAPAPPARGRGCRARSRPACRRRGRRGRRGTARPARAPPARGRSRSSSRSPSRTTRSAAASASTRRVADLAGARATSAPETVPRCRSETMAVSTGSAS